MLKAFYRKLACKGTKKKVYAQENSVFIVSGTIFFMNQYSHSIQAIHMWQVVVYIT